MDRPLAGRVALVTGANRGIGLEVCRQLAGLGATVILTSRDTAKSHAAARGLAGPGLDVRGRQLETTRDLSITNTSRWLTATVGRLDILVHNAGINYDSGRHAATSDVRFVRDTLETNLLGAWRVTLAFLSLLRASGRGRVVMVSSEAGTFGSAGGFGLGAGGGTPAYGVSKAALNALTVKLAADLRADGVLVNAVCPGWTATDLGEAGGRPVADGAAGVVWAAGLPADGPSGGLFRDGHPLPW